MVFTFALKLKNPTNNELKSFLKLLVCDSIKTGIAPLTPAVNRKADVGDLRT